MLTYWINYFFGERLDKIERNLKLLSNTVDQLGAKLSDLDPSYYRAQTQKIQQEIHLLLDQVDQSTARLHMKQSANERWSRKREEQQFQLQLLRSLNGQPQSGTDPLPNQLELLPTELPAGNQAPRPISSVSTRPAMR